MTVVSQPGPCPALKLATVVGNSNSDDAKIGGIIGSGIFFTPTETAENLKKHGGFIPGIRPGERTAEYIDYVLSRITVLGALYLAIVCLIPEILISYAAVPFYFGGTSLLIVVSVTMDTVAQIQGYLLAHQYEGLIKRSKLRGRTR